MANIDGSSNTSGVLGERACLILLAFFLGLPLSFSMAMAGEPIPKAAGPLQTPAAPGANANAAGGQKPLTGEVSHAAHRSRADAAFATAKHRPLASGPLLLSPTENTVVETPHGAVCVGAGSVALIVSSDKGLSVYNLHDTHKDAVVINYGSATVSISPECVAILAKSPIKSFEEANPAPFVAYRRLTNRAVSGEIKLYQAEFNFESMAHGLPPLRKLMESKVGTQHKTMGDMLKTAAIMTQISQSNEPYGYYVTAKVRALSAGAKP